MEDVNFKKRIIPVEKVPKRIREKIEAQEHRCGNQSASNTYPGREIPAEKVPKRIREKIEAQVRKRGNQSSTNPYYGKTISFTVKDPAKGAKCTSEKLTYNNFEVFFKEKGKSCKKDKGCWTFKDDGEIVEIRSKAKGYFDIRIRINEGFQGINREVIALIQTFSHKYKEFLFYIDENEWLCIYTVMKKKEHTISDFDELLNSVSNIRKQIYPNIQRVIWSTYGT